MRTLTTVGLALSLVAVLGLSASAGAPTVGGGGLFVESADAMSSRVTVSGEIRTRWEVLRDNMADFTSNAHDNEEWVDTRVRLGLLFDLAAGYKVFIQTQTPYIWGDDEAVAGDNDLELYQAYVQMYPTIMDYDTTLTIGRSELVLGSEMLLGNNSRYEGQYHDLVRLDFVPIENLSTSLFVAKVQDNDIAMPENPNGTIIGSAVNNGTYLDDTNLWGMWNTYQYNEDVLIDGYVLYMQGDQEYPGGNPAIIALDAKLWTVGSRLKIDTFELFGQTFDASAECAVQMGTVNMDVAGGALDPNDEEDLDVKDSFAFEVEGGWQVPVMVDWKPRLAMGMAWASGDDDGQDGNFNTFQPLFSDSTERLGRADLLTLSNLRCFYADLTCNPMANEDLTAGVSYYKFNAFEEEDIMGAGGNLNLQVPGGVNDLADEFDVYVKYKLSDNATLSGCWAWVEPDDMIHDTEIAGPQLGLGNSPAQRMHATLTVKF